MSARHIIEILAIMLAAGVVAELLSETLRIPRMIILLAVGAILGPHVIGTLELPLGSSGIQTLLTFGVSLILFYGGLGLSLGVLRRVAFGLGMLVIPGVVLTGAVTGAAAAATFGIPFKSGLLIGAVLASTDPAILIPLLERMRIRQKVLQTIVAESALNDVTGTVFSLTVADWLLSGSNSLVSPFQEFFKSLAISSAMGVALGLVLALAVSRHRFGILREMPALAAVLAVAAGYYAIDVAGGSGYLGAFLAGLIVGNVESLGLEMPPAQRIHLDDAATLAANIVVAFVFVTLGANIPFDRFGDFALPAIGTLAVFMFAARPVTVLACLVPDRWGQWTRSEIAFIAWTRETGVIPAAVAGLLVSRGVGHGGELVTTVGLAIILTLAIQSTTKPWLARRLRLLEGQSQRPEGPAAGEPGGSAPATLAVDRSSS